MRRLVSVLVMALVCALVSVSSLLAQDAPAPMPVESVVIETGQGSFMMSAEMATTPEERERGLMFRHMLPPGRAMLFVYQQPEAVKMWMKNTHIPLDMLFIRPDGRVAGIAADRQPMNEDVIASGEPVLAVLEIPAGTAARIGLQPGDRVIHPVFGNAE